jgi:hypothetical protein
MYLHLEDSVFIPILRRILCVGGNGRCFLSISLKVGLEEMGKGNEVGSDDSNLGLVG